MIYSVNYWSRRARLMLGALALLAIFAACGGSDNLGPSSQVPAGELAPGDSLAITPVDSSAVPADSTIVGTGDPAAPSDTVGGITLSATAHPGIVFAVMGIQSQYLSAPYNGSKEGLFPAWLLGELQISRAKGARMIVEMASGADERIQNADGTFSFNKWKALVYEFKAINFGSYITDGTLMGHFLIDEPQNAKKWGGKIIPQATVEAMAKYSKQLWPNLPTFVRAAPSWLDKATITYTYLDAAWTQYEAYLRGRPAMPEVTTWITGEVAAARRKRLGLVVGMNVLDGGNGSSRIPGWKAGDYAMSASELRSYGTALLNQTYACGFFNWTYLYSGAAYMARTDIRSAMTYLSDKAKAHIKTSCSQ